MIKVPVFVLSGFLGSGKTTLLKQLLQACDKKGITPAVLMNEIGKTDMDGEILLEKNNEQMMEKLLDGCICCSKKSEVSDSILKLLQQQPDVIFIELTGVANPEEVVDSLTEPELKDFLYLEKVITILDGENILEYNNIFETVSELVQTTRRQIEVGDLLIVNKVDLISESQKEKVYKVIKKRNSVSPIFFTSYSDVNTDLLLEQIEVIQNKVPINKNTAEYTYPKHKHHHNHGHTPTRSYTRINTITLDFSKQTKPAKIEKFLKKWRPHLLRAKGYIPLKDGCYLLQHVMKRTYLERSNYIGGHYLVMIGIDLNVEEVKSEWAKWHA
ncbi:CobW family GTP-binding protein [Evansella cellulosilytica]|uniref:Cobalamin synthesis protein P47K n=1 Tax=Evansella cellulosilytica (strain ATCC 21833 / DSM 2522 / FERM P-1141 / JCM 9156 / N-4) TaxID=649639 RepID=E6U0R2_EVAC2|nr:GTP-binding protein [Evansella cellulosilytica]ADU29110.1 cobalamin synthesis protein P47K [Evansella cellulosilytica DSM 2522]